MSDVEMDRAVEECRYVLVMKFPMNRPSIDVLQLKIIKTWGFSEVLMISFIDEHQFLLHLTNEKRLFTYVGKGGTGCGWLHISIVYLDSRF